jgi:hypothetical protein
MLDSLITCILFPSKRILLNWPRLYACSYPEERNRLKLSLYNPTDSECANWNPMFIFVITIAQFCFPRKLEFPIVTFFETNLPAELSQKLYVNLNTPNLSVDKTCFLYLSACSFSINQVVSDFVNT